MKFWRFDDVPPAVSIIAEAAKSVVIRDLDGVPIPLHLRNCCGDESNQPIAKKMRTI